MSKSTNKNSILVLATLGVYFGLVLVGATPQVLANAAMTREFSVKDEIEVKDDLDKKPDDCEKLAEKAKEKQQRFPVDSRAFFAYTDAFINLAESVRALHVRSYSITGHTYGEVGLPTSVSSSRVEARPVLVAGSAARDLDDRILAISKLFPAASAEGKERFELDLSFDDTGLATAARILRDNDVEAHQAFIAYDAMLDLWRCSPKNAADALISRNTVLSWSNSQVIVVTRLPRAGLDSLFVSNAK